MRRVFQHPTALQLVVNPISIVEVGGIMLVDSVAENDFEDVQHAIELLTQLYVMSIERQGFVGVAAARVFVFIEPCSRESILEIFIFHKNIAFYLRSSDILPTFAA